VHVLLGEVDKFLPQLQACRIAAAGPPPRFRPGPRIPGPVSNVRRAAGRTRSGRPQQPGRRGFLADVEQVLDEHAGTGRPVAVWLSLITRWRRTPECARWRLPRSWCAGADVHLLGDVGRGVSTTTVCGAAAGARRAGRRRAWRGLRAIQCRAGGLMKPGPADPRSAHTPVTSSLAASSAAPHARRPTLLAAKGPRCLEVGEGGGADQRVASLYSGRRTTRRWRRAPLREVPAVDLP